MGTACHCSHIHNRHDRLNYFSHRQAGGSVERKISDIITLIQSDYVDAVDTDSLLEKTIPDLLSKLDPHTVYIPASELTSTNEVLEGSFGGIGVVFNMMTDTATVVEVVSGGLPKKWECLLTTEY